MRPATAVPATRDGKVLDEVKEVLDVIAKNDMVLAAGHLHVSEIWLVFEEAKRRGVNRLVVNHPEEIIDASMNDVGGLTALGAKMEHSLCMFLKESKLKVLEAEDLRKHIEAAGVDNTIMSTDLGQTGNIRPLDGFRHGIGALPRSRLFGGRHPQDVLDQCGEAVRAGEAARQTVARIALAIRRRDCRQLGIPGFALSRSTPGYGSLRELQVSLLHHRLPHLDLLGDQVAELLG